MVFVGRDGNASVTHLTKPQFLWDRTVTVTHLTNPPIFVGRDGNAAVTHLTKPEFLWDSTETKAPHETVVFVGRDGNASGMDMETGLAHQGKS